MAGRRTSAGGEEHVSCFPGTRRLLTGGLVVVFGHGTTVHRAQGAVTVRGGQGAFGQPKYR